MAGFESAYVALSRMKQHVQVYTDNRQGWTDAINNAVQKGLFSTARELRDVAAGRAVLRQAGLAGETALHGLLHRDVNIRSRMWHCRRLTVTASQLVSG